MPGYKKTGLIWLSTALALFITVAGCQKQQQLPRPDVYWKLSSPAGVEANLNNLLPKALEQADSAYISVLYGQIGRAKLLQRHLAGADSALANAAAWLPKNDNTTELRWYLEAGRLNMALADSAKADSLLRKAWSLAKQNLPFYRVDTADMLARLDKQHSLYWRNQAIAVADTCADKPTRNWRSGIYNDLGAWFMEQKQMAKAESCFALARQKAVADSQQVTARSAAWALGKVYRLRGNLQRAQQVQDSLLTDFKAHKLPAGYVHEELAEVYLQLNLPDSAKTHFKAAYKQLQNDTYLRRQPQRLKRLQQLSN